MGIKVTQSGTSTTIVRPVEFEDALRTRARIMRTMNARRIYHMNNGEVLLVESI